MKNKRIENDQELVLPGFEGFYVSLNESSSKGERLGEGINILKLLSGLEPADIYGMPKIHGCSAVKVSTPLAFHEAVTFYNKIGTLVGHFVHFYIDDKNFNRFRNNPSKYIPMLKTSDFVIGPDWSIYRNYPFPYVLKNAFDNQLLSAFMEKHNIMVVANVVWCRPIFYNFTFAGQPSNAAICINSNSLDLKDKRGVNLWLHGYKEALQRLTPSMVIRFGKIVPGEEKILLKPIRVAVNNPYTTRMQSDGR